MFNHGSKALEPHSRKEATEMSHAYHTLCTVKLEPFNESPVVLEFYVTSDAMPSGERDAAEIARQIQTGWVSSVQVQRVDDQGEPIPLPDDPQPQAKRQRRRKHPKQLTLNF